MAVIDLQSEIYFTLPSAIFFTSTDLKITDDTGYDIKCESNVISSQLNSSDITGFSANFPDNAILDDIADKNIYKVRMEGTDSFEYNGILLIYNNSDIVAEYRFKLKFKDVEKGSFNFILNNEDLNGSDEDGFADYTVRYYI
ncbi:MAG: hypothetical protein JW982_13020 [Spirochaetes bacterium]|nr:hypothetical protein [Spirochaetota bacterium]